MWPFRRSKTAQPEPKKETPPAAPDPATVAAALDTFYAACKDKDYPAALTELPVLQAAYADGYAPPHFLLWLCRLMKFGVLDEAQMAASAVVQRATDEFFDRMCRLDGSNQMQSYHYESVFRALFVIEALIRIGTTEVAFADWTVDGQKPLSGHAATQGLHDDRLTESLYWVMSQCRAGQAQFTNPATGQPATSIISIGPFLTLMRCNTEIVIGSTEHPLAKTYAGCSAYLLIKQRVFLLPQVGNQVSRNRLLFALRDMLQRDAQMFAHAATHQHYARLCPVEMTDRHIGHYAWNVLPVWAALHETGALRDISDMALWEGGHVFGHPTTLYPELTQADARLHEWADLDAACDMIADQNLLCLPMQSKYISADLARRVVAEAKAHATDVTQSAAALAATSEIVIMLTIRTGRRIWTDQQDGYIRLIDHLHDIMPTASFLIDGATHDNLTVSTHRSIELSVEVDMAEAIKQAVRKPDRVINATGIAMADSIALSDLADMFVAPAGSGMTKYKWFTNKPGVAHANLAVLDTSLGLSGPLRVWDRYREDIIPAAYVAVDHVQNATPARDPQADYDLDMDAFLAQVAAFAQTISAAKQTGAGS